ncbi:MAG: DUF1223 domain-containing protein [Pseudomonadota bacterium]
MKRFLIALSLCVALITPPVFADGAQKPVLELFSSQACGNCPKANDNFAQFAERDDIIALTYPVGYWDYLGWTDTFAQPEFTERQKAYNSALRRRGPYTPQLIFNGVDHCSGARPKKVERKLAELKEPATPAFVEFDGRVARITGDANTTHDVWLISYRPGDTIAVPAGGANKGVEMSHHNLVSDMVRLGGWSGGEIAFDAACETACVVLVQAEATGPVAGAAQFETAENAAF